MLDEATLKLLSRVEIQKLARANHIKANIKTVDIIRLLVERSKNNEISGSVAGPTRLPKLEPADPQLAGPERPPSMEHGRKEGYGDSISAVMRVSRTRGGRKKSEKTAGEMPSRQPGESTGEVVEQRSDKAHPPASANPSDELRSKQDDTSDGFKEPASPLASAVTPRSTEVNNVNNPPALNGINIRTPPASPTASTAKSPKALTLPGAPYAETDVAAYSPSGNPSRLVPTNPDSPGSSPSNNSGMLAKSSVLQGRKPSPPAHLHSWHVSPSSAPNALRSPSPKGQGRKTLSSPLPPSSPPRSSPQPQIVNRHDSIQLERDGARPSSDSAPRTSNNHQASQTGEIPPADAQSQSQPQPQEGRIRLREPDSGDSAFSNTDNFYRPPPSDDSVNPEPMRPETYGNLLRTTSSLSAMLRDLIADGQNTALDVHSLEKDTLLIRHKLAQERANFWRMNIWTSAWTNPAKKWSRTAIWKQPIPLVLIDGKYVEVDSDDSRLQVELPNSDVEADGAQKNKATSDDDNSSSPSPLQKYMTTRAVSEPTYSPERLFSPCSQSSAVSEPTPTKKRSREEPTHAYENEEHDTRKIARKGDYSIADGFVNRQESSDDQLSSSPVLPARRLERSASPSSGDEDYVDEKSVESILDGHNDAKAGNVQQNNEAEVKVQKSQNVRLLSHDDVQEQGTNVEGDIVEIVDEAGERHRRYSAASKGKGRALA